MDCGLEEASPCLHMTQRRMFLQCSQTPPPAAQQGPASYQAPNTCLLRGRVIAGVPAVGSAGAEPSSQSSHAAGSRLCSRELWVAKPAQGAVWSQADSGEKRWCCVHLLQVPAPVKRVQRSYKSPVKSKSKSCLKGRVNSCGGTAGRAPSGEGEGDQRVSSWSFIWIHLAPSLACVTNVVNNCVPHLLPSGLFCSGF